MTGKSILWSREAVDRFLFKDLGTSGYRMRSIGLKHRVESSTRHVSRIVELDPHALLYTMAILLLGNALEVKR
jgi:hypothetical protein